MAEVRRLQAQDKERADAAREVTQALRRVEITDRDITTGEAKAEELRRHLSDVETDLAMLRGRRDELQRDAEAKATAAGAMPDPTEAIEAYMAHIASAEAVARSLRPWEAYDGAQADAERATAEAARITAAVDAVEADRVALIEAADIPVPGLSFNPEGEPIYNGRPLELASGGERVRIALAVAKAAGLGFTLIDEGDVLDDDMLAEIDAEARQDPGVQVLICSVGRSGPGLVQVVNGEAREGAAA
jgi:hypothetical protein